MADRPDDIAARSYSYLRTAMVGLLVALGVAVFHQTWRQNKLLESVSAYYYTSAQAVFVGGLIGLGVAMIALRGTTVVEEVALNLGGMFAILVAVVPTSRGPDHRSAVEACRRGAGPLLTEQAAPGRDRCPDVQALEAATRANVENNMVAILALGLLGLGASLWLVLRAGRLGRTESRTGFWWGFAGATTVWLGCLVALLLSVDWFVTNAHLIAAVGLLVCIFVVAVANALRFDRERAGEVEGSPPAAIGTTLKAAGTTMVQRRHSGLYAALAWGMVIAGVGGMILLLAGWLTLFWVEIIVALLFAAFWLAQTIEQPPVRGRAT